MNPLIVLSREVHARDVDGYALLRSRCGEVFDWLLYEGAHSVAEEDRARVVGAYLSADILELSSKTELTRKMSDFCDLMRKCGGLRFLQVPSAGLDRPFYDELSARGVQIWDARGIAGTTVALSAFTGMLMLARNMHVHFRKQYETEWFPVRFGPLEPRGIENNTAVIVGVGSIGAEIARLCKAVSMKTIGVRRTSSGPLPNFDSVVTLDRKDEVLPRADWVFLACPLTPETFHLMDADAFGKMKAEAGLINVARGPVADEDALIEALQREQVRCAYLDVFEVEPLPPASPLWNMHNVILTPHAAGDAQTRYGKLDERFRQRLLQWYASASQP
ncbi:D-2-hydroxyacid dehydrogenase [Achromobacter sp. GD03932]|uniref:D-2-hydroxyacid dehydrogenase n=1 Tax=Achromobacter sp. GD03932 TaxID=2975407 RepID=UPI00244D368B|nr:D-2-hydroxyacid dehydrogenase [Achromobacter sp. GD03932]MDH1304563.1 D-2-hydroxyacid dehydrogenase [Achromobacter sp. GD03932]